MSNFSFTTIDVPAAAGTYVYISVNGVDSRGEAVGNYGNVDGEGDGTFHGLIANPSVGVTFDPPNSTNTDVVGITSTGEIFGDYVDNVLKQHGFVDTNGVVTPIDVLLANSTTVSGVNDAGVIYGEYVNFDDTIHGFVDKNGSITRIDVPGANTSSVEGVNASGVIAGTFTDSQSKVHGFVDSNGSFKTINAPGAIFTSVVGISDAGVVVGNYQNSANIQHGFVDTNGVITTINIAGATTTSITAIAADGEIVGNYADSSGNIHGFVDQGGVITKVDVPGATETNILGISASGEITGYYNDNSGHQHGFVGAPGPDVIEQFGSTSLVQVGENYYLDSISGGTGPELQYQGAPVTAGQFGTDVLSGAEQVAGGGYDVAFKNSGTGLYTIWTADSSGNFTSVLFSNISGTNPELEAIENTFQQDLNGDGTIGLVAKVIESHGSTSLLESGSNYYLDSISSGTGPELQYQGAPVTAGQFGSIAPIGAEQTASGYDVAWKIPGTNQYEVWSTDSSGHFIANITGLVAGNSVALESLETTFQQDLNGDGTIGIPSVTIEAHGSTKLVQVGSNYYLDSISSGTGPELQYHGAPVTAGQFSSIAPIGAEQTASGYDVAWKIPGTNQYEVWSTDSSGHFIANITGLVAGNSVALESLETTFQQDLNGDGTIGIPSVTIEAHGSTKLVQVGSNYYLDSISSGIGPELQYHGAPVTAGQFSSIAPIGAEQTASGYDVAWKIPGTNQYEVWSTDSSGHFIANITGLVAGNSVALESLETTFQQDLNGDGVIGTSATIATGGTLELAAPDSVSVQFNGPTGSLILDKSSAFDGQITGFTGNGSLSGSDQIDLRDIGFGPGTTVAYTGTSSGGKLTVSDAQQHTASIELAGNYAGSTFSLSSDGSGGTIVVDPAAKQPLASGTLSFSDPGPTNTESVTVSPQNGGVGHVGNFTVDAVTTSNDQDSVAWHFNFDSKPGATTVAQSYEVTVADHHADGTNSTTTQSVTVTIGGAGNDAFVFHPGVGTDTIVNATSTDTIELDGFASVTSSKELASLLAEAQAGEPQSLFQTAHGGHDSLINLGNHDVITLTNVPLSTLHASDFIVH